MLLVWQNLDLSQDSFANQHYASRHGGTKQISSVLVIQRNKSFPMTTCIAGRNFTLMINTCRKCHFTLLSLIQTKSYSSPHLISLADHQVTVVPIHWIPWRSQVSRNKEQHWRTATGVLQTFWCPGHLDPHGHLVTLVLCFVWAPTLPPHLVHTLRPCRSAPSGALGRLPLYIAISFLTPETV